MASLKNAAKAGQRIHRERSQLSSRAHLGELEKKKDYRERAHDYQRKKGALQKLQQKALEKNPDEFYFHMVKSRVKNGVHFDIDEKEEKEEEEGLAKLQQNLRHIQHKLLLERKKIEKLRACLHLTGVKSKGKHLVFKDSLSDEEECPTSTSKTKQQTSTVIQSKEDIIAVKKCLKRRNKQYKELAKRIEREQELSILVSKLETRRNLQTSKGVEAKKVVKGNPRKAPVYKWAFERKR